MSGFKLSNPHRMYTGEPEVHDPITFSDNLGTDTKFPLRIKVIRPSKADGTEWDQTSEAAAHMRYAHSLNLPEVKQAIHPRLGRAIIVGGAPSIENRLEDIRRLHSDPCNRIFAINWSHTWLIDNDIVPDACVFFEIDSEPDTILRRAHPNVTYYICSHCSPKTFDSLKGYNRVLWHSIPNSEYEYKVHEELFKNSDMCGGGVGTFTRTLTVALFLGFRHFDIFGCDSSFPENSSTTHVEGYETPMDVVKDGIFVYAMNDKTKEVKRFKTLGMLALQHEEFKEYCKANHGWFSCRVHDNGLLGWSHRQMYPDQYEGC